LVKRQKTRSRRIGLLTENEIDYLEDKQEFSSKQRSKFLKTLLPRIIACKNDMNLIWDKRKSNQVIANWCIKNFKHLYNIGQSIHIRNRMQIGPTIFGRVKFFTKKQKGMVKGTRYYWFDPKDVPKQYVNKPYEQSVRFTGIKPASVKKLIIKAYDLGLIPNNKNQAVTIKQIQSKLRRKNN